MFAEDRYTPVCLLSVTLSSLVVRMFFTQLCFVVSLCRPYIIVKKGVPMVKNKHIEDLSQGYR